MPNGNNGGSSGIHNDYGLYHQLRLEPHSLVTSAGNVELVTPLSSSSSPATNTTVTDGDTTTSATTITDTFPLCHVASYLGFSRANGSCDWNQASKIFKELVAMETAMHHVNHGIGSVVPELEGLDKKCPLRWSGEYHDSQYTPPVVVQSLTQLLAASNEDGIIIPPCAVVGARTSSSTGPSAIVSGVYGKPQLSFTATSPGLSDRFKYPLFARVVPPDDAAAQAAIRFLHDVVSSTHIACLYLNDDFGNHYYQAVQEQAELAGMVVQGFPLAFPPDDNDIANQLEKLQQTGIRHVLLVVFSSHLKPLLHQATAQYLTGPDYFWMVGISTSFFDDLSFDTANNATEAALARTMQGMAILPEFGATPDSPGYHRFVKIWESLGQADGTVQYFNSKIPNPIRGVDDCFVAGDDFFETNGPGSTAHFAYDTVVAMALGACSATENRTVPIGDDNVDNSTTSFILDGTEHVSAILQTTFEGASGIVSIDESTASRDPLRFSYAVLNVLPQVNPDNGLTTFITPETIVLKPNRELTDWELLFQNPDHPRFIFQDGTSTPPPSLPPITVDMNYIGPLRIMGYVAFALIAGLSIGFSLWTLANRKVRVVRSSQPFFLVLVCAGTLLMGSMLIPLSMDDEYYDQRATNIACMSQPWLACLGFVTAFSALASKTWRINQLNDNARHFQRMVVTKWDVLVPFLLLASANIIILSCWTALAPLEFVRTPHSGTDSWNRVVSSTCGCRVGGNEGAGVPFLVALAVINLIAVVFANAQAYRARRIHTEFSESRYIGLIMLFLLQSWLTGMPVIGLVYDQPQAYYVVVTSIVSITSLVMILLIFVPKIQYTIRWTKEQEAAKRARENRLTSCRSDNGDQSEDGLKIYRVRESTLMFQPSQKSDIISSNLSHNNENVRNRHCLSSVAGIQEYMESSSSIRSLSKCQRSMSHSTPFSVSFRDDVIPESANEDGDVEKSG